MAIRTEIVLSIFMDYRGTYQVLNAAIQCFTAIILQLINHSSYLPSYDAHHSAIVLPSADTHLPPDSTVVLSVAEKCQQDHSTTPRADGIAWSGRRM